MIKRVDELKIKEVVYWAQFKTTILIRNIGVYSEKTALNYV